tara:strand:- start:652 stop:900 length:249 start_codon:yes stop_codon:yes gene_type:complete
MKKMNALEFYKSHESAMLPDVGDLVSLTVEELCELMEQYHESKVNNSVLDDVIKCDCKLEKHERAKMELYYNKCMDCKKPIE